MKNKKRFLLFVLLLASMFTSFSQGVQHNLEKYWYYRQRLKDKFMVESPNNEQGTNIPMSMVGTGIFNGKKWIYWDDGNGETPYYLGVLATEYRLLKDYGQDYTETLNELVYTLRALERLDISAEYGYGGLTQQQCLNGFFIRDDVDVNFAQRWASPANNWAGKNLASNFTRINKYYKYSGERPFEMSQDNVWHYLMNLALVRKLVDDKSLFQDASGEYVTINQWVKKITYRMVSIMHDESLYSFSILLPSTDCNWVIVALGLCFKYKTFNLKGWSVKNPITHARVRLGSIVRIESAGFAAAGNWITEGDYPDLNYPNSELWEPLFAKAVSESFMMHGAVIPVAILPIPELVGIFVPPIIRLAIAEFTTWNITVKDRDPYMESSLITVIGDPLFQKYNINNTTFSHLNAVMVDRTNFSGIQSYEHFPLIYLVLHSNNAGEQGYNYYKYIYENLLNVAPNCGPFDYGDVLNSTAPDYSLLWSSTNRLVDPQNCKPHKGNGSTGDYAGIDYMLLHNLYWLVYRHVYPQNRYVSDQIPFANGLGSQTDPYTLFSNNKIIADNKIKSNEKPITLQ